MPPIKDKTGNINDVSNYRGITLSPVISKLFEVVFLSICSDVLETNSLQFGFKDKIGTADAIFTLKSTTKHFTDRGSSIQISSLDIRKASDRVNHFKLYKSLLEVGVPVIIVDVICNWYSKLYYAVRWNGQLSVVLDRVRHFRPIPIHRFFAVNRIRYRYDTDFLIRFKSGRGAA